jgi:hypothetical protein
LWQFPPLCALKPEVRKVLSRKYDVPAPLSEALRNKLYVSGVDVLSQRMD